MVLIFPQTHVAVSLQAPDGNYAITNATALLKCINQKDLFVPTCWLWDISELQKSKKKKSLEDLKSQSFSAELDGVQNYGKLSLGS